LKVSVVITTYNRAGHLRRCLPTLLNQKTKPDEVIIIDDGSQDQTREIVKGLQNEYPEQNIKYVYNHNPGYTGSSLAKNIGIRQAKGEIIIFSEPEILCVTDCISQHLEWQKKGNYFVSAGTIYFVFGKAVETLTLRDFKEPDRIIRREGIKEWKDGYWPEKYDIAVQRNVRATYNASVKRDALIRIGGWDERFKNFWGWEDLDLQSRLGMAGIQCIGDESIQAIHLAHGYTGCFEVWDYNKKLHEDPNKPIIANQGKEWGKIIEA